MTFVHSLSSLSLLLLLLLLLLSALRDRLRRRRLDTDLLCAFLRLQQCHTRTVPAYRKFSNRHRRSQDFVWGAFFFPQKVDDLLVVALKTHARTF